MMYIHHMAKKHIDLLLFALLGIIWGTNFWFMKIAVTELTPLQVSWLRAVFGAIPVLALAWQRGVLHPSHWRYLPQLMTMAMLSIVVPYVALVMGTSRLPSGVAGALSGTVPLLTALMVALFVPGEKLSRSKQVGLGVGLLGALTLAQVWQLGSKADLSWAWGCGLVMVAGLGFASGIVYARRYIVHLGISPLALAGYQTTLAALVLTLIAPKEGALAVISSAKLFASVAVGLGLVGTGVGFLIYFRLIKNLGAVTASTVFYLPPVVALTVGAQLAGEAIEPAQWVGGLVILLGVFLAQERKVS